MMVTSWRRVLLPSGSIVWRTKLNAEVRLRYPLRVLEEQNINVIFTLQVYRKEKYVSANLFTPRILGQTDGFHES